MGAKYLLPSHMLVVGLALLLTSSCAALARGPVDTLLASAKPGAIVKLPAGEYGVTEIVGRRWPTPVTVDARDATFKQLSLREVDGLIIRGATVVTPNTEIGVNVRESQNISVLAFHVSGARKGIVIDRSENVTVADNRLTGLRSDGINIALSRRIRIERNRCENFSPIPAVYDGQGQLVRDGDHPDCIQAWSRPSHPPTADLLIAENRMTGAMQGIGLFNHVRNGVDDGGFDRIIIRGNRMRISFSQGIGLYDARDSVVAGNIVETIPGATSPRNGRPVRATINARGSRLVVCGNTITAVTEPHSAEKVCR